MNLFRMGPIDLLCCYQEDVTQFEHGTLLRVCSISRSKTKITVQIRTTPLPRSAPTFLDWLLKRKVKGMSL